VHNYDQNEENHYINCFHYNNWNYLLEYKDSEIEIENAQKIIGTRNRISHEYDNISDEVIWTIIIKELPKLKIEIDNLKNKH
jgi:uncharacterized protein with HEPN domain